MLIPFSFVPERVLKVIAPDFKNIGEFIAKTQPSLQQELKRAKMNINAKEYIVYCFVSTILLLIFLLIFLTAIFVKIGLPLGGLILSFLIVFTIFWMQMQYPKVSAYKRIRSLDVDLLAALSAITIQLSAGISLFEALVLVGNQNFGEVSVEFRNLTKSINVGTPQIEALELMAVRNPSPYFRRAIWQLINGMKEGSDINKVIEDIINNLTKEQMVQIEKYGAQLNPLVTFYMMGAIILPTLALTFIISMISFLGLAEVIIQLLFWGLFLLVLLFQIIFMGTIKSKRPSLLGS